MSDFRDVTFGEHLFSRIDDNVYLQKLYHKDQVYLHRPTL